MTLDTAIIGGEKGTPEWANAVQNALGEGNPAQNASYVIFYDSSDSEYKARNGTDGTIDYNGENFATVFNNAVTGLREITVVLPNAAADEVTAYTGKIVLKDFTPTITSPLNIPLGCRIIVEGLGSTQQMICNGVEGGTQIFNNQTDSAFEALSTSGAVTSSGTFLFLKNIEFVQMVNLASATTPVMNLDGMAQGILENVQVVKPYDGSRLTGTGIKQKQDIGGDAVGAPTLWRQVGVQGFTTGVYADLTLWDVQQLDIADCDLAMTWYICLHDHLRHIHLFNTDKFLKVYGGFTTYGYATIQGLYLEDVDDNTAEKWYIDSGFHGMLHLKGVNVNSCAAANLWDINTDGNAKGKIWFDNVVTVASTVFPAVSAPGFVDNTLFKNDKMQTVEVWANWTTINYVKINGASVTTLDNAWGTFLLRPGDTIQIDLDGGACTWNWRGVSAEIYHFGD